MSFVKINNLKINYDKYGTKGKKIILLHGWGQNTTMMAFIGEHLKKHFIIYNIDLPGFGKSDLPDDVYGFDEYSEIIHSFCKKLKIDNPIFIAHSFGCRIALRYAYKYGAYKMCLTGAAGIKAKRDLKWYIKVYGYKIGKFILNLKPFIKYKEKFENNVGSDDYKNASGIMKKTFVKVVNEDVTPLLKDIDAETLLVFGENDDATPIKDGKLMESLMPNAVLVTFENDDHFAYFHQANRFCLVLDAFLKGDMK